eukprot:NODE_22407_length_709_cov_6.118557.p2 GENE.NODE_22407_length_709_cov_6.118557~~NODE_22407_length_709_cov_6.118557.p2  ORF type:complete len:51 (-),score=15.41 NODE_22407_length_709_cov_6.118557:85-237(-)
MRAGPPVYRQMVPEKTDEPLEAPISDPLEPHARHHEAPTAEIDIEKIFKA